MSRINTLEAYQKLIKAGHSEQSAIAQVEIMDTSFSAWFAELKAEFISSKIFVYAISLMGLVGCAIVGELWVLSKDVANLTSRFGVIEQIVINNFEVKH